MRPAVGCNVLLRVNASVVGGTKVAIVQVTRNVAVNARRSALVTACVFFDSVVHYDVGMLKPILESSTKHHLHYDFT